MFELAMMAIGFGLGIGASVLALWPMYRGAIQARDVAKHRLGNAQRLLELTDKDWRDEEAAHKETKAMLEAAQLDLKVAQDALREAAKTAVDMAKPADGNPPAGNGSGT